MSLLERPVLSAAQKRRITREVSCSADLLFAGKSLRIEGNTPRLLERVLPTYGGLEPAGGGKAPELRITYRQEGGGKAITFLVNGEACRITDPHLVENPLGTIIYLVLTGVRDRFVVHAACLASKGRGMILAGESGMGKSTLAAHLAARGMDFLSDEFAPLNRKTGLVEPVPLRIGIRAGPAQALVEGRPTLEYVEENDRKQLIDVTALSGKPPAGPVPPGAVIFLTTSTQTAVATPRRFANRARVVLTSTSEDLEKDLEGGPGGTRILERGLMGHLPSLLVETGDPAAFLPRLRSVLESHGSSLGYLQYEDLEAPDFAGEPRLARIPGAAGVIELAKKMPGHHKSRIIEREFDGNAAMMIRELASLLEGAAFYRLFPGRLEGMIRLVEELP